MLTNDWDQEYIKLIPEYDLSERENRWLSDLAVNKLSQMEIDSDFKIEVNIILMNRKD